VSAQTLISSFCAILRIDAPRAVFSSDGKAFDVPARPTLTLVGFPTNRANFVANNTGVFAV